MADQEIALTPVGVHHSITALSAAVAFITPPRSRGIYMQAITQNVRVVFGGGVADATSGFQVQPNQPPTFIALKPESQVSVIEETASAGFQWQAAERWTIPG